MGQDDSDVGDRRAGEGVSVLELCSFSVEDIAGVLITDGGL